MRYISLVEALALLLSSQELRKDFALDPERVAINLHVNKSEREAFVVLNVSHLEMQANVLLKKRQREVFKLLPLTCKGLGETFNDVFRDYANAYWPDSHRRHEQDAYQFIRYLMDSGREYNQGEHNRVQFLHQGRKWHIGFVPDAVIKGRKVLAIQVLYRMKFLVKEKQLYLGA